MQHIQDETKPGETICRLDFARDGLDRSACTRPNGRSFGRPSPRPFCSSSPGTIDRLSRCPDDTTIEARTAVSRISPNDSGSWRGAPACGRLASGHTDRLGPDSLWFLL